MSSPCLPLTLPDARPTPSTRTRLRLRAPRTLEAAARTDHVAAEYLANQRSNHGFVSSDCLVMDIDNDHTEDPADWVTPQDLAGQLADVEFMTATSRNHNLPKGVKAARPRFHVYFPIHQVTDPAAYAGLKKSWPTGSPSLTPGPWMQPDSSTGTPHHRSRPSPAL